MKVFLAWSGAASEQLATLMHEWLPSVVQAIEPFMSKQDIRQGQRWASEIGAKLAEANFALLCLTPTNLESRWIHFEAGAVSKNIEQGRISALLLDVAPTQIEFPLQQFQHTKLTKDDLRKLAQDLNKLCLAPLNEAQLNKAFERAYPDVEATLPKLRQTLAEEQKGHTEPRRSTEDILTDLLNVQQGMVARLDAMEERQRRPTFAPPVFWPRERETAISKILPIIRDPAFDPPERRIELERKILDVLRGDDEDRDFYRPRAAVQEMTRLVRGENQQSTD